MITVLDTETTGTSEQDQVLEIATVQVEDDGSATAWSSLVRPTREISLEAMATHHITWDMLVDVSSLSDVVAQHGGCLPGLGGDSLIVAHNAAFDAAMLRQSGLTVSDQIACTWRAALHLYPDAPRHSNQVLRYYLGLRPELLLAQLPAEAQLQPHRALYDAVVTASIARRMLSDLRDRGHAEPEQELLRLSTAPVLLRRVKFGKYYDQTWESMDTGYLRWILSKDFDEDVLYTARHWLRQKTGG